jgi:hypothetical protein
VDFAARLWAESQLQARLRHSVPEAASARVSIHSFPFVGRLLVAGHVSGVTAEVTDLQAGKLRFSRVTVDLHDVRVDRDALVSERQVDLQSIGRGTASAELTQAELSRVLGVPITLRPGQVSVRVRGVTVSAAVAMRDNSLVVSGLSVPLPRIAVPTLPLLPCRPSAEVVDGSVRLSCSFDQVPPELIREVKRRARAGAMG